MTANAIEIEDLEFAWKADRPKVIHLGHLDIPVGQKAFVRGASGSGKTTLLNLLGGVISPQSGRLLVLGHDLTQMNGAERDRFRADHIGFVFQMFNLVPFLSLIENVLLPLKFSQLRKERLKDQGLLPEDEAERLLIALELDVGQLRKRPVVELSIGQQQRVAAARALIGQPEIVIADEPTSALDADVQNQFLQLLFHEINKSNGTLIFVSHDQRLEKMFDRSIILKDVNIAA